MHLIEDLTRKQDAPNASLIDSVEDLHWQVMPYSDPELFADFICGHYVRTAAQRRAVQGHDRRIGVGGLAPCRDASEPQTWSRRSSLTRAVPAADELSSSARRAAIRCDVTISDRGINVSDVPVPHRLAERGW
jgi:hypothetical protein